jgi:hypothetical protein
MLIHFIILDKGDKKQKKVTANLKFRHNQVKYYGY